MSIVPEIHASRLLEKTVVDRLGKRLGRVQDILVECGEEFPKVVGLEVRSKRGHLRRVPWSLVQVLVRQYLSLSVLRTEVDGDALPDNLLRLKRDLLDKQIVDLNGLKVRRINDLKLAEVNGVLRLVAVEVGLRGLLRRLGLRRLVHYADKLLPKPIPDYFISWRDVEPVTSAPHQVKLAVPYERLSKLHPADLADILEALNRPERAAVMSALDVDVAAETLQEMEPEAQADVLEQLGGDKATDILESMPADEAADILGDLPEHRAQALLEQMEDEEAEDVRELLEYEEDTAGRLMTTEVLSFREDLTAGETIEELRRLKPDPDSAYYLYVVDGEQHLIGVVSLRDLVVADPSQPLWALMDPHVLFVREDADKNEVAEVMTKYDLLAVPVVDAEQHLLGMALIHDVVDDVYLAERRPHGRRA
ncbi:MAG TPA: CBS domain-containing protein [Firmicutes bacterium]|nr:CBS domain-containing protein [Bacillota bacterium]